MSDSVPADDRGLLLGDGLFETVRLYAGGPDAGRPGPGRPSARALGASPFRLDAHLDRLVAGAAVVGIPIPGDLRERVVAAIRGGARGGEGDFVLRITLTRGSGWGLAPPELAASRLILSARPIGDAARGDASDARRPGDAAPDAHAPSLGLTAKIFGRVDERSLVAGLKTTGYLERIQAIRLARAAGADEALLRNSRDEIVEGSASNAIAIFGRTLVAPGRAEGALPGITREVVLEEARRLGYSVEVRGIEEAELAKADELLLTSSVREIVAVVRVAGRTIGSGSPGPVGGALAEAYRAVVRREVGA